MHKGILLRRAMRLERGAVVSFVGGGGKTAAMFRLANELKTSGWRVVTATTTHLAETQVSLSPASILGCRIEALGAALDKSGHCLVTGPPDGHGRMQGIPLDLIAELHARHDVDAVIAEADGSRSRSLKAPAAHEPAVPPATTHLVPVAGIDAIGRPLDPDHVHRPERVCALTGLSLKDPVTIEAVAQVLVDPEGGAKRCPPGARLIPLINKIEGEPAFGAARMLAARLMNHPAAPTVMLGSMRAELPVLEVWSPVAAVVLAAGQSSRFGTAKQLLPWAESTLVGHAAELGLSAGLHPVIVVTGYAADTVAQAVGRLPVEVVFNADFSQGQSTSVRRGISALPAGCGAAIFLLADQPGVAPETIAHLLQAHRESLAPIVAPFFGGRRGNPVLFDRALFPELMHITGDAGGRVLLERHESSILRVPVDDPAILQDIDTRSDYEQARKSDLRLG